MQDFCNGNSLLSKPSGRGHFAGHTRLTKDPELSVLLTKQLQLLASCKLTGRCRPARPKGRLYRPRRWWMLPQYASQLLVSALIHLQFTLKPILPNPSHLNFYSLSEASTPGPQVPNLLICRLRPLLQGGYPWPLGSRWSERAEALLGQQQDVASGGSRWDRQTRQTLTSCKLPGFQVAAFYGE